MSKLKHIYESVFMPEYIRQGIDVKTVQELFAHSSIATTQRYLHTSESRKKQAIEVLNSYN